MKEIFCEPILERFDFLRLSPVFAMNVLNCTFRMDLKIFSHDENFRLVAWVEMLIRAQRRKPSLATFDF